MLTSAPVHPGAGISGAHRPGRPVRTGPVDPGTTLIHKLASSTMLIHFLILAGATPSPIDTFFDVPASDYSEIVVKRLFPFALTGVPRTA